MAAVPAGDSESNWQAREELSMAHRRGGGDLSATLRCSA